MFKRLLKRKATRLPPVSKWYVFLNEVLKKKAERAARTLSRKTDRLSSKQLIYCLYTFSAIGVLLNMMVVISAFQARSTSKPIVIHNIPDRSIATAFAEPLPKSRSRDYERVLQIEAFLDSLQQSTTGKKQYDSFIQKRPHFRDSIARYKDLYENR